MARVKRTETRATRKRAKVVPLRLVRPPPGAAPLEGHIVVPRVDAKGVPMSPWRVAHWHLIVAAKLLLEEYRTQRGAPLAEDFARAHAITLQVFFALDANAPPGARARMREMARLSDFVLRTAKSDAERWLTKKLPATAAQARAQFIAPFEADFGDKAQYQGSANLARWALGCLAAQDHLDAARMLRRWGVEHAWGYLASRRFSEDVDELAGEIRALLNEPAATKEPPFARRVVRAMYRIVGLQRPFEAEEKKRRRTRL